MLEKEDCHADLEAVCQSTKSVNDEKSSEVSLRQHVRRYGKGSWRTRGPGKRKVKDRNSEHKSGVRFR